MKVNNIKKLIEKNYEISKFETYTLEEKTAFIIKKIDEILGFKLYDTQIEAGIYLYQNYAVDMKTGEGKSLSSIIPLILKTYEKGLSYFLTINNYLLKRDYDMFKPLFEFFNIKPLFHFNEYPNKEEMEKGKFIIYTTPDVLVTQYLRYYSFYRQIKINLDKYFLIDEADFVFIDNALRPVVLSTKAKADKNFIEKIVKLRNELKEKEEYEIIDNTYVNFTDKGNEKLEKLLNTDNIFDLNNFEISKNIEILILTELKFKKDVDYIVENSKIYLIDEKTGEKREFYTIDYTKQFIEYKEGVELSNINLPYQKITFQQFFKKIKDKSAMSGTVLHDRQYFEYYGMKNIKEIKRRKELKLKQLDSKFFLNKSDKIKNLLIEVAATLEQNEQSILIGTTNIKDSEIIFNMLKELYPDKENLYLLTAKNVEEEAEIIKNAGKPKTVTVITQIAGRGVDIKIDEKVKQSGGMKLLMFEQNLNFRTDEQIKGRVGRQGEPGEFRFYHSMDDFLIVNYCSQKIKNILLNYLNEDKNGISVKFSLIKKHLDELQKKHEDKEYLIFSNLAQFDEILNKPREVIFNFIEDVFNKKPGDILKNILDNISEEKTINELVNIYNELGFQIELKREVTKEEINNIVFKTITNGVSNSLLIDVIFKTILLNWQSFLTDSEMLLEGIVWRSKTNKDPLVEYDREIFFLFNELIFNIRINILKTLILYQIQLYQQKQQEN